MVDLLVRAVEFTASHDQRLLRSLRDTPHLQEPATVAEAERLVEQARQLLGVTVEDPLLELSAVLSTVGVSRSQSTSEPSRQMPRAFYSSVERWRWSTPRCAQAAADWPLHMSLGTCFLRTTT